MNFFTLIASVLLFRAEQGEKLSTWMVVPAMGSLKAFREGTCWITVFTDERGQNMTPKETRGGILILPPTFMVQQVSW